MFGPVAIVHSPELVDSTRSLKSAQTKLFSWTMQLASAPPHETKTDDRGVPNPATLIVSPTEHVMGQLLVRAVATQLAAASSSCGEGWAMPGLAVARSAIRINARGTTFWFIGHQSAGDSPPA